MMNINLRVNEIFESIEGEGIRAGKPAIFIRLQGCNLKCSYCDTIYAQAVSGDEDTMNITEIVDIVENSKSNTRNITITGGEPLLQLNRLQELIIILAEADYEINIETNGSFRLPMYLKNKYPNNLFFTMDYKSIFSGEDKKMLQENVNLLRENDVLKFVIANKLDLAQAYNVIKLSSNRKTNIFISPVFGVCNLEDIVDFVKMREFDDYNIRLQLQLHKIIWDAAKRGV